MTDARRVSPAQVRYREAQLEADVQAARTSGAHVWIVAAAFRVTEDTARRLSSGPAAPTDPMTLLDGENVSSLALGCYACEEPLTPALLARRCRPTA